MNSDVFDWADIRVFLAVLRHGSTLAAARALDMAQPTVARRIDRFEHSIGLTLFERDTRGFHPTDAARTLLPLAENIEAAATALSLQITDLRQTRPIRLTAFSQNLSGRVLEVLDALHTLHPEITLEFLPSTRPYDLLAGEADVAIRLTRSTPEPNLIQRHVSTAKFAMFAAPSYIAKYGRPKALDNLKGHKFLSFKRDDSPPAFHNWLIERVGPEQITATFSELELAHAALWAGRGIAITNIRLMENDPSVVQCSEPIEELNAEHLILTSPAAYRRPEVKAFIKFFAPRYTALFR